MKQLIATMDEKIRNNGFTFDLFIELIQKGLSDTKQNPIKQYFEFFDRDQSGTVSIQELQLCLNDLDLGLSENEIEQLLHSVFKNSEQELSYEAFSNNIKQITKDKLL